MASVFVYGLFTPGGSVRYIGQTTDPATRLSRHRHDDTDTHKGNWVRSVGPSNVQMMILQVVPEDQADAIEMALIARLQKPLNLVNSNEGGNRPRPSVETRGKQRAAKRGKKQTPQHIQASASARIGHQVSPETREKIAHALRGKKRRGWSAEARQHHAGYHHSPETRYQIGCGNRGKKLSPLSSEHRAKISAALKGRAAWNRGQKMPPVSHETRNLLSQKTREFWRRKKAAS
jgi:predicted GIY-YIG superfamily endonuclease